MWAVWPSDSGCHMPLGPDHNSVFLVCGDKPRYDFSFFFFFVFGVWMWSAQILKALGMSPNPPVTLKEFIHENWLQPSRVQGGQDSTPGQVFLLICVRNVLRMPSLYAVSSPTPAHGPVGRYWAGARHRFHGASFRAVCRQATFVSAVGPVLHDYT